MPTNPAYFLKVEMSTLSFRVPVKRSCGGNMTKDFFFNCSWLLKILQKVSEVLKISGKLWDINCNLGSY